MNKVKIASVYICLFAVSFMLGQKKSPSTDSFQIEGSISGINDGVKVGLIPGATHSSDPSIMDATVKDGKFVLTGKLKEPRYFYLMFFGKNTGMIPIMVENSKIKLTATAKINKESGQIIFENTTVQGSKSNDYFAQETSFKKELDNDYASYNKDSEKMLTMRLKASGENNKKVLDSIQGSAEWKNYSQKEGEFFKKVESSTKNLILKNKDTWWGPFFMMKELSYLTPEQKPLFESFSQEAKNSYYGQLAKEELYPKTLAGTKINNFILSDKDGKKFNSKDLFAGKKYILIDFWASWCSPCRKEIPNLKTAYGNYNSKGFEVLSISIDKDSKAWNKALTQENMKWPNLLDNNTVSKSFLVTTIPATFLVDQNGVIIATDLRGEALDQKLEELFKV
ncbi:redoxin family protein [Flavobacterium sp. FlaQc-47]|uniref:redoxin family protein n=1 Tax=Flavobacterium sp. FlaQc-47 TaxID=3374180 RepID=UPI003756C3FF